MAINNESTTHTISQTILPINFITCLHVALRLTVLQTELIFLTKDSEKFNLLLFLASGQIAPWGIRYLLAACPPPPNSHYPRGDTPEYLDPHPGYFHPWEKLTLNHKKNIDETHKIV